MPTARTSRGVMFLEVACVLALVGGLALQFFLMIQQYRDLRGTDFAIQNIKTEAATCL